MADNYAYLFKLIIIGDPSTGKSCLLHRFIHESFNTEITHTIGVEFGSKIIEVSGQRVKLQIWDTAGQERFRSVTRSYYRGAAAAILAFDISNRDTFNRLGTWLADARNYSSSDLVVTIVGNKVDIEQNREITFNEASEFATQNETLFLETSAVTGVGVNDIFQKTTEAILSKIAPSIRTRNEMTNQNNPEQTPNVVDLTFQPKEEHQRQQQQQQQQQQKPCSC